MIVFLLLCLVIFSGLLLQLGEPKKDAKDLDKLLPIYKIEQDCIISKQGDITIVYEISLPEVFTLSAEDYEQLHHILLRAIKLLPAGTILHKQDWYTEDFYKADNSQDQSFLKRKSESYFENRQFLKHHSYLMITRKADNRKLSNSVFSNLLRPTLVPSVSLQPQVLQDFLDKTSQVMKLLSEGSHIRSRQLTADEIAGDEKKAGLLERYCFLLSPEERPIRRDIIFKPEWQIGEKHVQMFSLADPEDLPAICGSRITYDKYSTDVSKFSVGFAASVGLLLRTNHIYNQFLIVQNTTKTAKRLETRRRRLQSLSAYSRENAISCDATNAFLSEMISQQRQPVKAHFNIITWTDNPEELKDLRNKASSAIAQMDASPRQEIKGAPQLFWASLPGNAADLPINETFDSFAEQATCFLAQETNYRTVKPEQGIRFTDRFGRPVYEDLFDLPRTEYGWTSNMGLLCCGSSGGGKSMTLNHILRSLYDQDAHCVIIDIGGSYKGLCELVKGYYFTYEEKNPIKFNPFWLPEGLSLDTEKKESLKSLLIALWKQENDPYNRSEYVALSNALQGYYQLLENDESVFPCFNTFYEYLQTTYAELLKEHRVKDKDFDLDNFLYVLRPYYKNGEFDYLLNATENLNLLDQRFIVIELDNLKDHPVLFSVVTLLVTEMFVSKMRKLAGTRKVLIIDEAWKAIARSGMADFLKYAFKTIRKFNGIPGVVTQELDDLVSSPIIKDAIINNADIKILMDMRKFMFKFDKLQDVLGLSDKAKTILLSVNKDNHEIFIDLGGQMSKVFKNELCPEEYFAYTTDGKERVRVLEYAERFGGDMELAIGKLLEDIKKEKHLLN
ncbi:TraG family conjugative transposon ATPase [Niabella beijingensis]|uniref:TraG family conjugative transposon ATPase n=1 Tax=Niabella beijingensis TaxID=2872700 RepID=UPI001CBC1989|nr:TraG family conjugative transposon ATPase [Niabella beijingensis]MBZ4188942.1 TraG family conjugative transposon ATPase [Niabella beijingensis]